jgi:hypothetical protein
MTYDQYQGERGLSIPEASKFIARARDSDRPAHATVWRWCKRGIKVQAPSSASSVEQGTGLHGESRTVRLDYLRIGRQIRTTEEAVNRFLEATQDHHLPTSSMTSMSLAATPAIDSGRVAKATARVKAFMTSTPRIRHQPRQRRGQGPASSSGQAV